MTALSPEYLAYRVAYNFLLEGPNVTFVRRIVGQSTEVEENLEKIHRIAEDILVKVADDLGDPYE